MDGERLRGKEWEGVSGMTTVEIAGLMWFREMRGASRYGAESNEKCGMREI